MITDFSLSSDTEEAIKSCIRRKDFSWSEDFFLKVISNPRNKMEVYWSVLALRKCGSDRSIPALKSLATYPKQDVKACSILTIAKIAGASETEYFGEALLNPKYPEKGYALWAIYAVADSRAVKSVLSYFCLNISKIRSDKLSIGIYGMGVEYLLKHSLGGDEERVVLEKLIHCKKPTSPAEEKLFQNVKSKLKLD